MWVKLDLHIIDVNTNRWACDTNRLRGRNEQKEKDIPKDLQKTSRSWNWRWDKSGRESVGVVGEMSLDSSRLLINFSTEKTIMKGYISTKIKMAYWLKGEARLHVKLLYDDPDGHQMAWAWDFLRQNSHTKMSWGGDTKKFSKNIRRVLVWITKTNA